MWRGKIAAAAQTLYPRIKTAEEWGRENESPVPLSLDNPAISGSLATSLTGKEEKPYADLPRMARFLLVASYLCSYNPTRADVRIISKLSEDRGQRLRGGGIRKARAIVVAKVMWMLSWKSYTLSRCYYSFRNLSKGLPHLL
jgi:Origin recognition complex (ORC) subunit 5 C-terminus